MEPIIIVHGGVGDTYEDKVPGKLNGVKLSARTGFQIMQNGGSAVDAVEAAVRILEDDENFNAGYGSVLNVDGEVEMDACIMNGKDLNAGAVALVQDVANPISLARKVMENSPHTLLAAHGAKRFAREQGMPIVDPKSLITEHARIALDKFEETGYLSTDFNTTDVCKISQSGGTVGAVAIDKNGHVSAAASTGGMNGKMIGRIGDTPLIGSGAYADDLVGAVATTGYGESNLKFCVAHNIIKEMELGKTAQEATKISIDGMTNRLSYHIAGAITLSKTGDIGIYFSSKGMAWAWQKNDEIHFGINHGHHETEIV